MNVYLNVFLSVCIASSYVVSIRTLTPDHLKSKPRDDVDVIWYRFKIVSVLTVGLCVGVPIIMAFSEGDGFVDEVNRLHLVATTWVELKDIGICGCAIACLYCGPIIDYMVNFRHYLREDFTLNFCTIHGIRDHIFAPVTEEIIYRSILVSVLSRSFTNNTIILYGPLLFGIAHIHHGYDLYKQQANLGTILMTVAFQTLYTTIFGMVASFVFLKYNSTGCSIIIHSGCNLLGFPQSPQGTSIYKLFYISLLFIGVYLFYSII